MFFPTFSRHSFPGQIWSPDKKRQNSQTNGQNKQIMSENDATLTVEPVNTPVVKAESIPKDEHGETRLFAWQDKIPVRFTLSERDIASLESPHPVFKLVSRFEFIHLAASECIEYFKPFSVDAPAATPWFSFKGQPLKWQMPMGVIFDSMVQVSGNELPIWSITVHFSSFPKDALLQYSSKTLKDAFIHSLKQSSLISSDSNKMMSLPEEDVRQLWHGVESSSPEHFWEINNTLRTPPSRAIPIRIVSKNKPTIQPLILKSDMLEEPWTLLDLIEMRLMDSFPITSDGGLADDSDHWLTKFKVLVSGIQMDSSIELEKLYMGLASSDNFLYLTIVPNSFQNTVGL
eukprot:TRINITY_DN27080_c0_g2_i1.p1 TRINITY_DN27080_c0_g2~~TRINITY_DN27080_c0_g2_i1.p1  ORF type:complete len:345 (+),score=58.11 TRINITY_DN27080_c0_g2_i1:400-1434(+)